MTSPADSTPLPARSREEPLSLLTRERDGPWAGVPSAARCLELEFSSRGDRVPARLLLPRSSVPAPLILCSPSEAGRDLGDATEAWLAGGAAVARVDLPLLGERASAKLSERLELGPGPGAPGDGPAGEGEAADSIWSGLYAEFLRQSVSDLQRTLDAVSVCKGAVSSRVAFAGRGLGAVAGLALAAHEARVGCFALWPGALPIGAAARSLACADLAGLASRPLLLVESTGAAGDLARALYECASEPREIVGESEPTAATSAMTRFLLTRLGL